MQATQDQKTKTEVPQAPMAQPLAKIDPPKQQAMHASLASALVAAQAEFTNPVRNKKVKFPTKNGSEFVYWYADLAGIMDMIRPLFAKHGLALLQPMSQDTKRGEITLKTVVMHTSGEKIESEPFCLCSDQAEAQTIGSRVTYLRRYALCSFLGIVADDDTDAASPAVNEERPARKQREVAIKAERPVPVEDGPADNRAGTGTRKAAVIYKCPHEIDGTDLVGVVPNLVVGDPERQVIIGLKGGRQVKSAFLLTEAEEGQFFDCLRFRWEGKDKPHSDPKREEQRKRFYDKNTQEMLAELAAVLEARCQREKLEQGADGYVPIHPPGPDGKGPF